ncbi:hypothetical protein ZOSMA_177G00380 [Zostera marina]|uniref:Protein kinase domain-containing protein n=1 Tax=Zostera marina TaxID=29655 RepID=A0A0K9PU08_ZOSMR|nr:hypothetical protein ZOSMA_177G00380 [Zostera marina]
MEELLLLELNLLREIITYAANQRLSRQRESWEIDLSLLQLQCSIPSYIVFDRNVFSAFYGQHRDVTVKVKELFDEIEVQSILELIREKSADWQTLDHPNVTKFLGASFLDYPPPSFTCCVLAEEENPAGMSLKEYFQVHHNITCTLPFENVLGFALQLAKGLSYLHSKNIIHGNLIPENLFVLSDSDSQTSLKIRNWVATAINRRLVPDDDLSGVQFMAPELFGGTPCNQKSDVYSLGVCFWAIYFCNEEPYGSRRNYQIISHLQLGRRPFIPPHSCPIPFASIMRRCWDGNPDSRPSICTVVTLLESIDLNLFTSSSFSINSNIN